MVWVLAKLANDDGGEHEVFLDSDFTQAVGITATAFQVDAGQHTFSVLDGTSRIAWESTVVLDPPPGLRQDDPAEITLEAVP